MEHNRLLHIPEGTKNDIVSDSNQTNLANDGSFTVQGLLQIAPVRIYAARDKYFDTFAVCDSASSQTWMDEDLMRSLCIEGTPGTISVSGIHGTSPITCLTTKIQIGPSNGNMNDCINVTASSHKSLLVGTSVYNINDLKVKYPHLSCIKQKQLDLRAVKMIFGQDAYPLIRPLE